MGLAFLLPMYREVYPQICKKRVFGDLMHYFVWKALDEA